MRKNTQEVFSAWIAGKESRKESSIWTDGEMIYSYDIPILRDNCPPEFRPGSGLWLDVIKYSRTTSTHQNGLRALLETHGIQDEELRGTNRGPQSGGPYTLNKGGRHGSV
jgi:hypothetical protein